ncbi:MAG: hypothetical protein FIB03_15460 [Anaerolineae bacterium]|nr:hypothetical protein [Anaerolineae bacterium]
MSDTNHRFPLALEALAELKMEMQASSSGSSTPQAKPMPAAPSLNSVLSEIGPLPREALFLGIASDGLPVLLNLHDPLPGPLLVTADAGAGKTIFLQTIAQSLVHTHNPEDVQYGVITKYPEEWEGVKQTGHCVGIFPTFHNSAQDFILSLASWAHENKNPRQAILLMIDDLEEVARLDFDTVQNLRWLLLRGPARRVWPVITMNAERYGQVLAWIPGFRTRIFGRIKDGRVAGALGGDKASAFDTLEPRVQFSLRESENWIRFWLAVC